MRILALTHAYLPHIGGIEQLLHGMAAELVHRGHEVQIISADRSGPPEVDGVLVHRTLIGHRTHSPDPATVLSLQRHIATLVNRFDPHVVHSHDMAALLWTYQRATRTHRRPLVATVHNTMTEMNEVTPASLQAMAGLLRGADLVTTVSERSLHDTLTYAPFLQGSLRHVPNGVQPPPPGDQTVDRNLLVGVGRLVDQKGWDIGIDAMRIVHERHPRARLVIAGIGANETALRRQIDTNGLGDVVNLVGQLEQDETRKLMARAAMVLMPSRFEGLPLVALEAAWAERPVVGTRTSGLSEAVIDGVTGVLVDREQPTQLADAALGLLENPERADALGRAARTRAEQEYSLNRCVDRYEAIYHEVMSNR